MIDFVSILCCGFHSFYKFNALVSQTQLWDVHTTLIDTTGPKITKTVYILSLYNTGMFCNILMLNKIDLNSQSYLASGILVCFHAYQVSIN